MSAANPDPKVVAEYLRDIGTLTDTWNKFGTPAERAEAAEYTQDAERLKETANEEETGPYTLRSTYVIAELCYPVFTLLQRCQSPCAK